MILLHALEAPHDIPGMRIRRGDVMYHLLSDQPGAEGTAELLRLARNCGAHDAWLQAAGTYREHFDLFGRAAEMARALGAQPAGNAPVGEALKQKRAAMTDWPEAVPTLTSHQMAAVRTLLRRDPTYAQVDPAALAAQCVAELAGMMLGCSLSGSRISVLMGPGQTGQVGQAATHVLAHAGAAISTSLPPEPPDLIIDALLGDGIDGPPYGRVAAMIQQLRHTRAPILAIDLPSGLEPNEDGPFDPCVVATATLALGVPCRSLALWAAAPFTGDLWLAPLGVPRRVVKQVGAHPGPGFITTGLLRLERRPLAGDLLASPSSALVMVEH